MTSNSPRTNNPFSLAKTPEVRTCPREPPQFASASQTSGVILLRANGQHRRHISSAWMSSTSDAPRIRGELHSVRENCCAVAGHLISHTAHQTRKKRTSCANLQTGFELLQYGTRTTLQTRLPTGEIDLAEVHCQVG